MKKLPVCPLKKVLSLIKKNTPLSRYPLAIRLIVWEVMKLKTKVNNLEGKMAHKKKAHMKQRASAPHEMKEKAREMPIKGKIPSKHQSRGK